MARRDTLDVLLAKKAMVEARKKALAEKADPLAQQIAIAAEKRERDENGYLGAVARELIRSDEVLKRRFAFHADLMFPDDPKKKYKKPRNMLERLLGPLAKAAPAQATPEPVEFEPTRPKVHASG